MTLEGVTPVTLPGTEGTGRRQGTAALQQRK